MDLTEIVWDGMDRINVVQDRDKNIWGPKVRGNSWLAVEILASQKRTELDLLFNGNLIW